LQTSPEDFAPFIPDWFRLRCSGLDRRFAKVVYDKDGQPYTVKYQFLAPMLLNEVQKQHAVIAAQQDVIKGQQEQVNAQQQQIQGQQQQIEQLQRRLSRLEALVGTQASTAAERPPQVALQQSGGSE
jgi:uncharacterized coiled-coil protein SlyX